MLCEICGALMRRTGTCHTCPQCGHNTGCGRITNAVLALLLGKRLREGKTV